MQCDEPRDTWHYSLATMISYKRSDRIYGLSNYLAQFTSTFDYHRQMICTPTYLGRHLARGGTIFSQITFPQWAPGIPVDRAAAATQGVEEKEKNIGRSVLHWPRWRRRWRREEGFPNVRGAARSRPRQRAAGRSLAHAPTPAERLITVRRGVARRRIRLRASISRGRSGTRGRGMATSRTIRTRYHRFTAASVGRISIRRGPGGQERLEG